MEFIIFAIIVTFAATVPYRFFNNWRQNQILSNLQTLSKEYSLSIEQCEEAPDSYPNLTGTTEGYIVSIKTTLTSEGVKFPVTHVEARKPDCPPDVFESVPKLTILPNRSFMTTPDESYLKTGDQQSDHLYLVATPKDTNIESLPQKLCTLLKSGIKASLCDGQLKLFPGACKFSIPDHISSDTKMNTVRFLLTHLKELTESITINDSCPDK